MVLDFFVQTSAFNRKGRKKCHVKSGDLVGQRSFETECITVRQHMTLCEQKMQTRYAATPPHAATVCTKLRATSKLTVTYL